MDYAQLVQDVIDGNESGLTALAVLKEQKKFIDDCIEKVQPSAQDEADSYQEKTFDFKGYSFEKRSGGRSYSFKHIPEWIEVKAKLTKIETISKQAYASSQTGILTATEDGEEILFPVVTNRKDSIVIKKKNSHEQ